jgi:hypothetical protein
MEDKKEVDFGETKWYNHFCRHFKKATNCSLKTKQSRNVNVLNFSLFKKDNEQVKHFLESLILAQDERWRRA